ncbi:MAG TPA: formate--tetrahydrofolate ligase, partial [Isosphaeraceae bacterium]|nr:formate--tetrahydrofolate ligase [Isosphaeraceae bacterium]
MGTGGEEYSGTVPLPIEAVAAALGLRPDDVEPFGRHKGKLALGLEQRLAQRTGVRYVGVSAVSPTPLG